MEENVFPLTVVKEQLEKMVLLKLYTDRGDAISDANSKFQEDLTGTYSLPTYTLVTPEGQVIATTGYTPDGNQFAEFLKKGTAN